jgi:uncharacterized repeat protein (TIGR01451 family)
MKTIRYAILASWLMGLAAQAQVLWTNDVLVINAPGDQGLLHLAVVSDKAGGAYVVWRDRLLAWNFIQRLDAAGGTPWGAPKFVAFTEWEQFEPAATEDGFGGVIVAWVEGRSGWCGGGLLAECDVYAQRFDADGVPLWLADGVPVCTEERNQGTSGIGLVNDGTGGVFLTWEDARPGCCKVFAQHLDATGAPTWTTNGVRISVEPFIAIGPMDAPPRMVSDGNGGAFIAWINNQVNPSTDEPTLNVQHVNAAGQQLWTTNGVPVGFPSHVAFSLAPDGQGGLLLAFARKGSDLFSDIAVQRVDATGKPLWGTNGVAAAPANYFQEVPDVVSDGTGGAIVVWVDHRHDDGLTYNNSDIFAQRINAAGLPVWPTNGLAICELPGTQDNPRLVSDGAGGAIIVWKDCRGYVERDPCFDGANIYAQHITGDGTKLWPAFGALVTAAPGSQGVGYGSPPRNSIALATDEVGGAVLAWPDGRNGFCANAVWMTECDVYAQRINDNFALVPVADLAITSAAAPNPMPLTGNLQFTLTLTNRGPEVARDVWVVNPLPADTQYINADTNLVLAGHTLIAGLGSLPVNAQTNVWFAVLPLTTNSVCNAATVLGAAVDEDESNNGSSMCIPRTTTPPVPHDVGLVKLKAPKKITLKGAPVTKTVAFTIQNFGPQPETITADMVRLDVLSLGACPNPPATLVAPAFPVTLAPKKKLTVVFAVTFDCANDPLPAPAWDYQHVASVSLPGDVYSANNACPHDPATTDKGCGGKKPDKTFGADVVTDIVQKP